MNSGLIFRPARFEDGPELARLRWEFSNPQLQTAQPFEDFKPVFLDFWSQACTDGNWRIYVAERPDGLAGTVFMQIVIKVPRPARLRRMGYITNMYLEPGWRGQGAGARLMELVMQEARDLGLHMLLLWPAKTAVGFYQRLGFRQESEAMELDLENG